MAKLAFILLVISLSENVYPAFNITAVLIFLPVWLFFTSGTESLPSLAPKRPVRWLVLAYSFWLFSYLLTRAPISNLFSFDFLRRDGALFFAYLPLLLLKDYELPPAFVERMIGVFLSSMAVIAVLGGLQYLEALGGLSLSSRLLPQDLQLVLYSPLAGYEFHGFFEAHNAAGAVYGLACSVALALLMLRGKSSLFSMPTFWFGANFLGLTLSKSRSAYLAFLAAAAFLFLRMRDWRRACRILVLVLLPLGYFVLRQPEVQQRAETLATLDDPNILGRYVSFQIAWEDFQASPLIGIGFGRYNDDSLTFSGIPSFLYVATGGAVVNESSHAHDSYLHFLAEGGIVGLGLMLAIWVSAYRWARELQRSFVSRSFPYAMAGAVQACVVFGLFVSLTEHAMGTGVTALTIFTMFGLLRNLVRRELLAALPSALLLAKNAGVKLQKLGDAPAL